MNRYCIVHIPQGDIENYFKNITLKLDEKFNVGNISKKIFQHITLRHPFETDGQSIEKVEESIKKFITSKKSFNYKVKGFSKFPEDNKTIFLSVHENNKICNFRQDLINILEIEDQEREFKYSYNPHMSIIRDLNPESFEMVWEYVQGLTEPHFDLVFDNIAIIVKNDGMWSVYKSFGF